MAEKLSNVIGAPFDKYILDQLRIRAVRNSTVQRSNEEVLYLANKAAWVRMISSVNITSPNLQGFYNSLELPTSVYNAPESLAKNWILQAGTSKQQGQDIALRYGFGPDGAYGLGGTEELGYRPLPGLTSARIETAGRLGSLRQATISFKVWNMNQLNVVEALYFRLGYSMLLEWGHVQFFNNPTNTTTNPDGIFQVMNNSFGLDDPFLNTDKTVVQQKLNKKSKELSGNYDGMLGIVSNFNWSMNEQGGYDCSVKLIGLGSIISTTRINQSYKMPEGVRVLVKKAEDDVRKREEIKKQQEEEDLAKRQNNQVTSSLDIPVPKNKEELYLAAKTAGYLKSQENFFEEATYWSAYKEWPSDELNVNPDYFYLSTGPDADIDNTKTFGLFVTNGGTTWDVLHPSMSNTFKINYPLFNSILEEHLNIYRNTPKDRNTLDKSTYKSPLAKKLEVFKSNPLEKLTKNTVGLPFIEYTRKVTTLNNNEKNFSVKLSLRYEAEDGYYPKVGDFLILLDKWSDITSLDSKSTQLIPVDPYFKTDNRFFINRQFRDLTVVAKTPDYDITVNYEGVSRRSGPKSIKAWVEFEFDNTALIGVIENNLIVNPPQTATEDTPNNGDTGGVVNEATAAQSNSANTYESALHVMLSAVKTLAYAQVDKTKPSNGVLIDVEKVDITVATKAFYQDGIFKDVFEPLPSTKAFSESPFNVTYYAQKGFSSNLLLNALTDSNIYGKIPTVNFKELCQAYVVEYSFSENTNYPVYISLGYLLAFLNNMCLIYDSKQNPGSQNSVKKTPYVYIDFNPETNLCLSTPQHLSIDPRVCLIPFEGTDNDYRKIFPAGIVSQIPTLFKPNSENYLRSRIPKFKSENSYQGKTMNILLNVDFLIKKTNDFATANAEHAVYLKDYLEAVMTEVNKSLGNLNLFRVAYDDNSNTVQIKDDQWVPHLAGEPTILVGDQQTATQSQRLGELPIFGLQSLVRSMQFKTNVSTKLGSMIAISAQAATGSINATDMSSLSYLNKNYQDRFKPYISDAPSSNPGNDTNSSGEGNIKANNDLAVADHFNQLVSSIYNNFNLNTTEIEASKNYYIERLSKTKSNDIVTSAAPFIPADLEITIDGIAGILMGNAFTIPESRLPISLRGEGGIPKVGFIVAGLVHSIDDNQWLTSIRGQMIKLRGSSNGITDTQGEANRVTRTPNQIQSIISRTAVELSGNVLEDSIKFIKGFEGLYSAKPGGYVPVTNLNPNTVVYAYQRNEDVPTIGWGTTRYKTGTKLGQRVSLQDTITVSLADAEIRAEVVEVYSYVRNNLKAPKPLTNTQLIALISLGYNAGIGNLTNSKVWKSLQQGVEPQIVAQLITSFAITQATTGDVLPGLISRRKQESSLFLS